MARQAKQEIEKVEEQSTAVARPDYIPKSREGTEHMTRQDLQLARLLIAQALSPQLQPNEPLFIEGLHQGEMFNSLTNQIIGNGPMEFFILRADPPRYVEFIPRKEGGGVKDPNVPPNDPRTRFGPGGEPPIATMFYDYVILPWPIVDPTAPLASMIALSMKSTQLKVARRLNMMIYQRGAALCAGKYTVQTVPEKNSKGSFYNYNIKNAGWAENEEMYNLLKALSDQIRERELKIDREPGDDDPDSPGELANDM